MKQTASTHKLNN